MQIPDYPDYQIHKDGRVWSNKTGRLLNPGPNNQGYLTTKLANNTESKTFGLHQILALAYIPNPLGKPCVDHINRNYSDNRLENLRWLTQSENCHNSDCLGYYRDKRNKKYISRIRHPETSKRLILGYFPTPNQARYSYICASLHYFPGIRYESDDLSEVSLY